MTLDETEDILGPGKEFARSPGVLIVTWQRDNGFLAPDTIISITFENNQIAAKAILGP